MKRQIKIRFQNGLTSEIAQREILNELVDEYDFVESESPDFILFGPYGNDIPSKGNYTRIGYFCENIKPDFSICEWAFGVPRKQDINHPKYERIQWHGLNPEVLLKNITNNDIDEIFYQKSRFCNFLYSHQVPYRERFFKELSKYKKVDSPGASMNNMPSIDTMNKDSFWERKRDFLSQYKFTIAFENYSYPGYQTEKLYDAMQVNSIPIYCGDPYINEIFNTNSFVNAHDYIKTNRSASVIHLEQLSQMDFTDIRPQYFKSSYHRVKRKIKAVGRGIKMNMQFNNLDFSAVIDRIVEIDKNPGLYLQYLTTPWFNNNIVPTHLSTKRRWTEIFNSR